MKERDGLRVQTHRVHALVTTELIGVEERADNQAASGDAPRLSVIMCCGQSCPLVLNQLGPQTAATSDLQLTTMCVRVCVCACVCVRVCARVSSARKNKQAQLALLAPLHASQLLFTANKSTVSQMINTKRNKPKKKERQTVEVVEDLTCERKRVSSLKCDAASGAD